MRHSSCGCGLRALRFWLWRQSFLLFEAMLLFPPMATKGDGPVIGINLSTTYSCVGVWQHDRVEINIMNPINTVFDANRLIVRKFNDTFVQSDIKALALQDESWSPLQRRSLPWCSSRCVRLVWTTMANVFKFSFLFFKHINK